MPDRYTTDSTPGYTTPTGHVTPHISIVMPKGESAGPPASQAEIDGLLSQLPWGQAILRERAAKAEAEAKATLGDPWAYDGKEKPLDMAPAERRRRAAELPLGTASIYGQPPVHTWITSGADHSDKKKGY